MHNRGRRRQVLSTPVGTWGLRVLAGCALLIAVAFLQYPGMLVSDTKFDLAVSPVEFLRRALHLWDSSAAFGQLQDQSYGYLWPMGPFFALGHLVAIPGWVVQRLWFGLVLCVAFVGAARLVRVLGVRRDAASLVAGFAYALSPALLTKIGPISSEAWPFALAPWVLVPLIRGTMDGPERISPRRAGLFAGVAVAMVGGINASATLAVLPLGVVWLVTRARGHRQWRVLGWWTAFTVAGSLWWLAPLVILGRYSPPFLDFIESARTTTYANGLTDAVRGTTDWVPYVDSSWQAGHELITTGFYAVDIAVVVGVGLLGIAHRGQPHRLFLLVGLLTGLVLVTWGHLTGVSGWFAQPMHDLLDGALAPIRNLHKLDPVLRLPLVIGLGWAVEAALDSPRRMPFQLGSVRSVRVGPAAVVVVAFAVVATALPAWAGRLAPANPVESTPGYWSEVVDWTATQDRGIALLLPGSSFGHYLWGSPDDEPMQYLDAASWAVRNAVPLAPPGNIRMLDAIEARLAQGEPSDGLASYLRRAGVGLLVVRNDLAREADVPADALVVQALTGSPGIDLVQGFGPDVGGDPTVSSAEGRLFPDAGWQRHRQAIEVYQVEGTSSGTDAGGDATVQTTSTDRSPVVVGGPEDLLSLTDLGVIGDEPTVLGSDEAAQKSVPTGSVILTDGQLDREQNFGQVHDAASAVLTPGDERRTGNVEQDYAISSGDRWRTTAELVGASSISASSARSDSTAVGGSVPGDLPFAAIDGDPSTQWVSDLFDARPTWKIELGRTIRPNQVTVTVGPGASQQVRIKVRTDTMTTPSVTVAPGSTRTFSLDGRATDSVEVLSADSQRLALSDVAIPEVTVRRRLVLPTVPESWGAPDTVVLRALHDARTGCVTRGPVTPCLAERASPSEEPSSFERVVSSPQGQTYGGMLTVQARPGAAFDQLVQAGSFIGASASSEGVPDTRASAIAALDGRPGTTWVASIADEQPSLEVHWLGTQTITAVTTGVARTAPVRQPSALHLTWNGGEEDVSLDSSGTAILPSPITSTWMSLTVTDSRPASWVDASNNWHALPVGISRLRLEGLPRRPLALSTDVRDWGCGSGPSVLVDGTEVQSSLVASAADLFAMKAVQARPCSTISLAAGTTDITVRSTDAIRPLSLTLESGTRADGVPPLRSAGQTVTRTGAETRTIVPSAAIVDQGENVNGGWQATQHGEKLTGVTLDGWRQGWLTRNSSAPIRIVFAPDPAYRIALALGLVGLAALLVLALVALVRRRTDDGAALNDVDGWGDADWPAVVIGLGVVSIGGILGGTTGAAVILLGMILGIAAARWRPEVGWVLVAVATLAGGLAYATHPYGSAAWAGAWAWPAYLTLGSIGVAGATCLRRWPKRVAGRSTNR